MALVEINLLLDLNIVQLFLILTFFVKVLGMCNSYADRRSRSLCAIIEFLTIFRYCCTARALRYRDCFLLIVA